MSWSQSLAFLWYDQELLYSQYSSVTGGMCSLRAFSGKACLLT